MTRPTLSQLAARCRIAAYDLPVRSEWRHYGGNVYEIVGFGVGEASGEIEVEYRPAAPLSTGDHRPVSIRDMGPDLSGLTFHRPLAEWQETVTVSRGELMKPGQIEMLDAEQKLAVANERITVPRFTRVYRQEVWSTHA